MFSITPHEVEEDEGGEQKDHDEDDEAETLARYVADIQ